MHTTLYGRLMSKGDLLIHWNDGSKERLSRRFVPQFLNLKDGDLFRADVDLESTIVTEVYGVWKD